MGSDRLRAVVLACALLVPAAAHAQSAADREAARGLMEDGDQKREKGDLKGALDAFGKADAIMHVPTTGLEVARVQVALGKLIEARETLARVAKTPPAAKEPPPFKDARKQADALDKDLATRIPTVAVTVSGADVFSVTIDGESAPNPETPRKTNPGRHTIVAKGGGNTTSQDVTLAERDAKTVPIELKAAVATVEDPAPPPKNGWEAKKDGDSGGGSKGLMYAGFGIGAVGIVVGGITGILSITKVNSVKQDCPGGVCPASRQADIDSAKTLGTVSTVAFVIGGVGVAMGVIGLVTSKPPAKPDKDKDKVDKDARTVEPILGVGYAGVRGTF